MKISMNNGRVEIDGKSFVGQNIQISGNKVLVDGKAQAGELVGDIIVTVHGDVQSIDDVVGKVTANNVGEISTGSGDINCGAVSGGIRTGSGDVHCGTVEGNIKTGSGDVYHRQTNYLREV